MKRTLIVFFLIALATAAFAQDATISFVDGWVDVRTEGGAEYPADFGDELNSGDRVITDRDGVAELELATGGEVSIDSNTVFIVGAATTAGGERTNRLSAAIGSFAFRFNSALGNEPQVGSTTSVAGVRGTEVRVYTGSDGTTRFEVIEGLVEIQNRDQSVQLGADDGIEISPGSRLRPESVFAFLEQPIDYAVWNAGLVEGFLDDPLGTLEGVSVEMRELIDEIERRGPEVDAAFEEFYTERDKLAEIGEKQGDDARQKHYDEVVEPLQIAVRERYIDFRFVVLSALSLDQYVISRLAAEMEAEYFLDPSSQSYREFRAELESLRSDYERTIAARLAPTDLP